jgi:transcriptional regulator with PAS, ATPase and Fis domain
MQREHEEISLRYSYEQIIGKSPGLKKVLSVIDRFTDTDSSVFIHGESGTGKELIARALHFNGSRKSAPFIAENCAALAESLLESELFGHVRGAFTGADRDKMGLIQLANHGTLFLDEIGDMPLAMQAKLLRALQEAEIRPVGGREYHKVNIRVITASHPDLRQMVEDRTFRQDLFYRLNVIRVNLPPLRDRGEDILLLADHFLEALSREAGRPKPRFNKAANQMLMDYHWPGNIRELQNEMQRIMLLGTDVISPTLLSPPIVDQVSRQRSILSKEYAIDPHHGKEEAATRRST